MTLRGLLACALISIAVSNAGAQTPPPSPSGAAPVLSQNPDAQKLMVEAEAFFNQDRFDEALEKYQAALAVDPALYEAALFSGDVYLRRNDLDQAQAWYEKAIAIDPARETGHRYSATPFMRRKQYDEARERYIEAYLLAPYNPLARGGLQQWAKITNTSLAHPAIEFPVKVTLNPNGPSQVSMDPRALTPEGVADGSSLWVGYGGQRVAWFKGEFLRRFPEERVYRHSLAEEAEALSMLVQIARKSPQVTGLSPSLTTLARLVDEGLLEAYVLLARPDAGIAVDYAAYLRDKKDTLRRYVTEYLLTGGGR